MFEATTTTTTKFPNKIKTKLVIKVKFSLIKRTKLKIKNAKNQKKFFFSKNYIYYKQQKYDYITYIIITIYIFVNNLD